MDTPGIQRWVCEQDFRLAAFFERFRGIISLGSIRHFVGLCDIDHISLAMEWISGSVRQQMPLTGAICGLRPHCLPPPKGQTAGQMGMLIIYLELTLFFFVSVRSVF